jgi:Gram-negative bacterial TonB protein C-terminal
VKSVVKSVCLCALLASFALSTAAQGEQVFNESINPVYFEHMSYPLPARLAHVAGVVVVRARLDDKGIVISSVAISGPKALISECISNSKKWRFQPNEEKAVVIVYRFKFEGLCNLPCASQSRFEPPNFMTITIGDPVVDHGQ